MNFHWIVQFMVCVCVCLGVQASVTQFALYHRLAPGLWTESVLVLPWWVGSAFPLRLRRDAVGGPNISSLKKSTGEEFLSASSITFFGICAFKTYCKKTWQETMLFLTRRLKTSEFFFLQRCVHRFLLLLPFGEMQRQAQDPPAHARLGAWAWAWMGRKEKMALGHTKFDPPHPSINDLTRVARAARCIESFVLCRNFTTNDTVHYIYRYNIGFVLFLELCCLLKINTHDVKCTFVNSLTQNF